MQTWAQEELAQANLGDVRLNKRLMGIVENLSAQPTASVPQGSGDWATTKATYNFWKSSRIEPDAIQEAHQLSTIERIKEHEIILAIQDTTTLNFTRHPAKEGMGPIGSQPYLQGLLAHNVLVASESGVPLGLIHQQTWATDPEEPDKQQSPNQREIQDKESYRWLLSLVATELVIPPATTVVTVADRESDIYELFALQRQVNSHLLIRGNQNRCVNHEAKYLHQAIAQTAPCGQLVVEVPRGDEGPARQATLTLRFTTLELQPPKGHLHASELKPVKLQVVLAHEQNPPKGVTPISWLLLTTLAVNCFEDAVQCVRWYTYRWLIERFHYVLKSGCQVEKLQLETRERIERALATYSIVAWRLLWLTYEARTNPDAPCNTVLELHEWQALYCTIHQTATPPPQPPSLQQAVRWIAKLGGFLGRKHDGNPGVKTIWRGLRRLHDIAATWKLLRSDSPQLSNSATYG